MTRVNGFFVPEMKGTTKKSIKYQVKFQNGTLSLDITYDYEPD
jgi:hypothetical protein